METASDQSMKTRIIDKFHVSPPPGSVPETSVPLTLFDVAWLFTGPVERLFFFPLSISTVDFTAIHLPALRSSLSRTLQLFYPLSGRVRPSPDNDQFEFHCSTTDSVPFFLAESCLDFDQVSGNGVRDFADLYSQVPPMPAPADGTIPLTAVQATVFPGHGVCIGVAVHHVACDDSSSLHFVKSWAAACRNSLSGGADLTPPPSPFFDRTVISDPDGLCSKTLSEMKEILAGGPPPPSDPPVKQSRPVIASFLLKREQIDALKRGVLARAGGGAAVHCSGFTVACAVAWVSLIKSQSESKTDTCNDHSKDKKRAHLLFSVECRARLNPPIPGEYFGNCLRPCFVETDMWDLISDEGVFNAAEAIGKAIKGLEQGVLLGAEGWFRKILSLVPYRPMSVGGSPRYKVYDVDFGWGRASKVELPTIEKTPGTVSLAESREEQGGIEIGLVLPENEMHRFSSCFSTGLFTD